MHIGLGFNNSSNRLSTLLLSDGNATYMFWTRARAHLASTTVVDSLSPQRSAGRGAFDLCLPMVSAELLLSPTLSSTPRRKGGLVAMSRCAQFLQETKKSSACRWPRSEHSD